jgi:hypothetical protein
MTDLADGPPSPGAPEGWVPVEHRIAGIDRRTILPALLVLALALVAGTVLPRINASLKADDPVEAGDVMNLGSGFVLVPTEGWNIESGVRVGDDPLSSGGATVPPVKLTQGTVVLTVSVAPFSGTPDELLDQVNKLSAATKGIDEFSTTDDRTSVTTTSGQTGVVENFSGSEVEGKIAAFVIDGKGVTVSAIGVPDDIALYQAQIEAMVESIAQEGAR